jgi:predicted dehydrogenase
LALAAGAVAAGSPAARPTIGWRGAEKKQLNIGIVGVGGRGFDHVREIKPIPSANVIALCDVDSTNLTTALGHYPGATSYVDFRELLKHPSLEAVVIATPDHTHAVAAAAALRAGKHVYCEKPLTYTLHECRALIDLAKQTKLVTQVGMQVHTWGNYARVVEVIQSGAIGPVRNVHIWVDRPWPDVDMSVVAPPAQLNYDLWLGPVESQPYHPGYHPMWWRRWSRFSNGILGDIACHFMDVAFWALELRHPTRIEVTAATNRPPEITPDWRIVHYDFPARGAHPALKLHWYDGGKKPDEHESWKIEPKFNEGVMFIGDNGSLFTNYWEYRLFPQDRFKDFKPPAARIPPNLGIQAEWIAACLKNDPAAVSCPFDYGGTITESALLGTLALRAGKPIDWDGANLKVAGRAGRR